MRKYFVLTDELRPDFGTMRMKDQPRVKYFRKIKWFFRETGALEYASSRLQHPKPDWISDLFGEVVASHRIISTVIEKDTHLVAPYHGVMDGLLWKDRGNYPTSSYIAMPLNLGQNVAQRIGQLQSYQSLIEGSIRFERAFVGLNKTTSPLKKIAEE